MDYIKKKQEIEKRIEDACRYPKLDREYKESNILMDFLQLYLVEKINILEKQNVHRIR